VKNDLPITPYDTLQLNPAAFDSTTYWELKLQKRFNYYNQLPDEPNWWQGFWGKIFKWWLKHVNPEVTPGQFNTILIIALIILAVLVVVFLYIYKPSLFYINRKQKLNYRLEDEAIEGINFDRFIQQALEKGEYAEAIRWNYLKVLKRLNEKELISFNPTKTVNEYVQELKQTDLKTGFRNLSRQFIYYRYGNGVATRETFEKFRGMAESVL
jgi:hypothetical protein